MLAFVKQTLLGRREKFFDFLWGMINGRGWHFVSCSVLLKIVWMHSLNGREFELRL